MTEEEQAREDWRRGVPGKDAMDCLHPIEEIRKWQVQYADKIRPADYGPDGTETIHSLGWRAADAVKAARLAIGNQPHQRQGLETYETLRVRMGWSKTTQQDIDRTRNEALERFHKELPRCMAFMGVGQRCIDQLGDLVETDGVRWVRAWLGSSRRWALILCGAGGSGKSVALAEAVHQFAREVIRYGEGFEELQWRTRKAHYALASDMLSGPIFGPEGDARFQKLLKVELLCIDDLGAEVLSEQAKDFLWRIVDGRYRNKRRTLMATNLSYVELVAKLGERFARRMATGSEDGAATRTLKEPFRRAASPSTPPP